MPSSFSLTIKNSPFNCQIVRKPRRKTVSISVKPDCSVRVLVPAKLPEKNIVELLQQKQDWIQSKITFFQENKHNHQPKEYVSGETFTYLGKKYRLKIVPDSDNESVKLKNGKFVVHLPTDVSQESEKATVKKLLLRWYREHAIVLLQEKTLQFALQIGLSTPSVEVKDYKSRWGSCRTDGRIFYNWRIIIAPQTIVDYVVIHELCHLVHANHSKHFWKLVWTVLPDYLERKDWLKANGTGLML